MESKKWYLSKTVWVNLMAAVSIIVAQFQPKVAELIKEYFSELGSAWVVINLVLRFISKGKLEITSA